MLLKGVIMFMLDIPTDQSLIEKLYEVSGVIYFNDEFRFILESVIRELYYSNQEQILKLRTNHIDRAINKFSQAKERRPIRNTKQYFKACILSAILETGLDELYITD
jgi:hypothetical protein